MGRSLIHLLLYLLGLESAHTQTTQAERAALVRHATGRKQLVEIGVYEGFTTAILAGAVDNGSVIHAIDPFLPGRLGICWGKLIAKREIGKAKSRGRVEFLEHFSHEAASLIRGEFDFVFIDADHSLEGIRRDWADWSPRIRPGGIMALHDTQVPAHDPSVAQLGSFQYFEAHIRHDNRFEVVEQVDSLTILRRSGGYRGP